MSDRPVIVITGPTASGKSALALEVAARIDGEIISMDSRQVYRGMDIGTAKPTVEERRRIPHHGIDLIEPGQRYSAGQFARDARAWINDVRGRGNTPLVVGGTLFFLRALEQPLFDEPVLDEARRDRLRSYLNAMDIERLRQWSRFVSETDATVPADRQRMARLVEIATLSGRPLAEWHRLTTPSPGVPTVTFVMTLDRDELYRRIDARVVDMVRNGFVQEVQGLLDAGYQAGMPGMNATGYLEMIPHLTAGRPIDETIRLIQAASRQYARRQLTWLRTQTGTGVIPLDAMRPVPELADAVLAVRTRQQGLVGARPSGENAP